MLEKQLGSLLGSAARPVGRWEHQAGRLAYGLPSSLSRARGGAGSD